MYFILARAHRCKLACILLLLFICYITFGETQFQYVKLQCYLGISHLQEATNTLERVAPLTHAVGNVLKRVFVIGFSILVFGKYLFLPCLCTFGFMSMFLYLF